MAGGIGSFAQHLGAGEAGKTKPTSPCPPRGRALAVGALHSLKESLEELQSAAARGRGWTDGAQGNGALGYQTPDSPHPAFLPGESLWQPVHSQTQATWTHWQAPHPGRAGQRWLVMHLKGKGRLLRLHDHGRVASPPQHHSFIHSFGWSPVFIEHTVPGGSKRHKSEKNRPHPSLQRGGSLVAETDINHTYTLSANSEKCPEG